MFRDYYAILGILDGATNEQIRDAFRRQALAWHPDRNPDAESKSRMQAINEAYLVLREPSTRRLYDRELKLFRSRNVPLVTPLGARSHRDTKEPSSFDYDVSNRLLRRRMAKAAEEARRIRGFVKDAAVTSFKVSRGLVLLLLAGLGPWVIWMSVLNYLPISSIPGWLFDGLVLGGAVLLLVSM